MKPQFYTSLPREREPHIMHSMREKAQIPIARHASIRAALRYAKGAVNAEKLSNAYVCICIYCTDNRGWLRCIGFVDYRNRDARFTRQSSSKCYVGHVDHYRISPIS